MNIVKYILVFVVILVLGGCASPTLLEKYSHFSDKQIFDGGEKALNNGDMQEAAEHFEALQAIYPFSKYARQSQLDVIFVYYGGGEFASADAAAQRYIHLYPMGPHTDYALYMKGLSEFTQSVGFFERHFALVRADRDLTSYKKAFVDFEQLIQRYPDSLYAADAHKRLIYLRNMFAEHYLNIGEYYYTRKAYVAAAQQAGVVVKNYQRTSSVADALVLQVRANRQLGLTEQTAQALAVLKANYPDRVADANKDS